MLREAEADALGQLDVFLGALADALVLLGVQALGLEGLRARETRSVGARGRAREGRARAPPAPRRAVTQCAKYCSTRLLYIFSESFICIVSRLRMNSGF